MATLSRLSIDLVANSASFRKDLDKASRSSQRFSKKAQQDFNRVAMAAAAVSGAVVAMSASMVRASDELQNVRNRMFALTKSADATAIAMKDIAQIAKVSRSDIASVGDVYTKMSVATKGLGYNQEQLAQATAAVSNSFLLSGASSQEAANSARQLAQGLASGRLNGDELRSVMENNVVLSGLLADGFGVTRGQLRLLGEQGKLTADKIMPILIDAFKTTKSDVDTMAMTFGQATTQMRNSWTIMMDKIAQRTGIVGWAAGMMSTLATNMEQVARVATFAIGGAFVAAMVAGRVAIINFTRAIAMNPIGLALVATSIAVAAAGELIYQNWNKVQNFIRKSFTVTLPNALDYFIMGFDKMVLAVLNGMNSLLAKIEPKINDLIALYNSIPFVGDIKPIEIKINTEKAEAKIQSLKDKIAGRTAGFVPTTGTSLDGNVSAESSEFDFGAEGTDDAVATSSGMSPKKLQEMTDAAETLRGAFESMAQPISSVFTQMVKGATSAKEGFLQIADLILTKVISSFVEMGVNWVLQQTMMKAMEAAGIASSVAGSVAAGSAMAAAYAPAAALASLASFGANSAPASAGILSTMAITKTAAVAGQFHDGIDNVPNTGTYLLEKGERVVDNRLNGDLKDFLDKNSMGNQINNNPTLNFNVTGGQADEVENMLLEHRGKFESMIRDIYHESAQSSPF